MARKDFRKENLGNFESLIRILFTKSPSGFCSFIYGPRSDDARLDADMCDLVHGFGY